MQQAWVFDRPLSRWPTSVSCDVEGLKVGDFIDQDGYWERGKLEEVVGEDLLLQILAIPISKGGDDRCVLSSRFSGLTIAKLSYNSLASGVDERFTWLRKAALPPKVRFFWWRVLWSAIPTFGWLAARGLFSETACFWACSEVETIEHLVSGCQKLAEVVGFLRSWQFPVRSFSSLSDCLSFLATADQQQRPLVSLFCISVYWLWRTRNDMRFGRQSRSSRSIAVLALAELPHLSLPPLSKQWCHHQPPRLLLSSLWCTPPSKWIKVNLDGSQLPSCAAGIGVVFRDEFGNVLRVAGRYLEHWDAGMVELEAFGFLEGLVQEWMFTREGLIIEGDNLNVIKYLQQCLKLKQWKEFPRLASSFELLLQFHGLLFSHISRESNRVADFCARRAARLGSTFCYDGLPPDQTELHV